MWLTMLGALRLRSQSWASQSSHAASPSRSPPLQALPKQLPAATPPSPFRTAIVATRSAHSRARLVFSRTRCVPMKSLIEPCATMPKRSPRQQQMSNEITQFSAEVEATLANLGRISDEMLSASTQLAASADNASAKTALWQKNCLSVKRRPTCAISLRLRTNYRRRSMRLTGKWPNPMQSPPKRSMRWSPPILR